MVFVIHERKDTDRNHDVFYSLQIVVEMTRALGGMYCFVSMQSQSMRKVVS